MTAEQVTDWRQKLASYEPHLFDARIVQCDLRGLEMQRPHAHQLVLEHCDLTDAKIMRAAFWGATIRACLCTRATLRGVELGHATIEDSDFRGTSMDFCRLDSARVTRSRFDGASFRRAVLDLAVFESCTFRAASFAAEGVLWGRTSICTTFVECDLSLTNWTNRDLRKTRFVRCRLGGATGTPASVEDLELSECDVDRGAFLAQLGAADPPRKAMAYRITAQFSSSDLKRSSEIWTHVRTDDVPNEVEARAALMAPLEDLLDLDGGDPGQLDFQIERIEMKRIE